MAEISRSLNGRQNRSGVIVVVVLLLFLMFGGLAALAGGSSGFAFGGFFLFFIVVIIIGVARAAMRSGPGVQRPYTQQTAFAPPPLPDTMLVKCQYCGMSQAFSEKCSSCGAPLPRPGFN